ncbi:MAG: hypothetical protein HYR97_00935 [Candidatus Melainabacteria bacterium]|nr:hypothetical protein [Candidatus Melainabacteria bacterium]
MLVPFIGEDNSESFFNTDFNEAYHSKIGPIAEAKHKFIAPSCLEEYIKHGKKVKILDLFFGLGYNTGIALERAYAISNLPEIKIEVIECDINIIKQIKELKVPGYYKKWQEVLSKLENTNHISFDKVSISLNICDANQIIHTLPKNYYDVIFYDPFSHKTCPEFWMEEFLGQVFNLLSPNGTLTTYSGLKRVKKLAEDKGFTVTNIEPIGRKKPSLMIKAS